MTTEEKIIELLLVAGLVSEEKMAQTRRLAESLRFDDDPAEPALAASAAGRGGEE